MKGCLNTKRKGASPSDEFSSGKRVQNVEKNLVQISEVMED